MRLFRKINRICFNNFIKWPTNYKVWIAMVLLIILVHSFTKDYGQFCVNMGVSVSPWIYPFLYSYRFINVLFFAPLLLIFCDAPFIDSNQPYVIVRGGRTAWSIGQIFYIVFTVIIYFVFIFIITIILNLRFIDFTFEWGKVINTLANTNAARVMGLKIFVSERVVFYFRPIQAVWFTLLLSSLCGIFLGMLIYVVNSITGKRSLGIFLASFFLILDAALNGSPIGSKYSPVSWCSLNKIDIGNISSYPSITYVLAGYLILIGILMIVAVIVNKKQVINILQPV